MEPPLEDESQAAIVWWWLPIALVAVIVRVWGLNSQSFTMDEWFEVHLARENVSRVLFEGDGFPPLYNLVLRGVVWPFGDGAARWLSVVLSLLTIPVVGWTSRILGGRKAEWWTCASMAIMPLSVWYAQESRAYSLMLLSAALSIYFATRLSCGDQRKERPSEAAENQNASRRDWIGFGASVTLGIYSHYFFVFLPIMLGVSLLIFRGRSAWRPLLTTAGCVIVACIPWLLLLSNDFQTQVAWPDKSSFGAASLAHTYFSFLLGYTIGPSLRELHTLQTGAAVQSVWPVALIGLTAGLLILAGATQPFRRVRPVIGLLAAPVFVGVVCLLGNVGYHGRYISWCHLVVAVCLGVWLSKRARPRLSWCGAGVMAALLVMSIVNRHMQNRYKNTAVNEVAQQIQAFEPRPILVVSGYLAPVLRYYLDTNWKDHVSRITAHYTTDTWQVWRISNLVSVDDRFQAFQQVLNEIPSDGPIWFVYGRSFHEDPAGALIDTLKQRGELEQVATFAGAALYSFEIEH